MTDICLFNYSSTGSAAPTIAADFSDLAPTLGTMSPVLGAGGLAAGASDAGSVARSVAIAASVGGQVFPCDLNFYFLDRR